MLAAAAVIALASTQLWAWKQAQRLHRELAEVHPDLAAISSSYRDAVQWSLFSPDLFGVGDQLLRSLTSTAERILDSYHGDSPTTTQRGWQAAYDHLHAAAQIAPRDRKLRARMIYARAHLDRLQALSLRSQGDRKQAQTVGAEAIAGFKEAARDDPSWPDPYLGLARIYAYDQFDLDALQQCLGELGRRGYPLGKRETAMLADGFRIRGLSFESRAQRRRRSEGDLDLLKRARDDLDQAVRFYSQIPAFAGSASNREEARSHLEAVEERLAELHPPSFWERLGRAIEREFGKRPPG